MAMDYNLPPMDEISYRDIRDPGPPTPSRLPYPDSQATQPLPADPSALLAARLPTPSTSEYPDPLAFINQRSRSRQATLEKNQNSPITNPGIERNPRFYSPSPTGPNQTLPSPRPYHPLHNTVLHSPIALPRPSHLPPHPPQRDINGDYSLATILEDARTRFNIKPRSLDGLSLHSVWQGTHNHNELRAHYYPISHGPQEGERSVAMYKMDIGTGADNLVVLPRIGPRGTAVWAQGVVVEAWLLFEVRGPFFMGEGGTGTLGLEQQPGIEDEQQDGLSQVLIAIQQSGLDYDEKPAKLDYHPGGQGYQSVECWTTTYTLKASGGQAAPINLENQQQPSYQNRPRCVQTKGYRFRLEFSGKPESIKVLIGQTNSSSAHQRGCFSIKLDDNINPRPPPWADQRHVEAWRNGVSNALAEEMRLWQRVRADLERGTFMVKTWEICERRRGEEQF